MLVISTGFRSFYCALRMGARQLKTRGVHGCNVFQPAHVMVKRVRRHGCIAVCLHTPSLEHMVLTVMALYNSVTP